MPVNQLNQKPILEPDADDHIAGVADGVVALFEMADLRAALVPELQGLRLTFNDVGSAEANSLAIEAAQEARRAVGGTLLFPQGTAGDVAWLARGIRIDERDSGGEFDGSGVCLASDQGVLAPPYNGLLVIAPNPLTLSIGSVENNLTIAAYTTAGGDPPETITIDSGASSLFSFLAVNDACFLWVDNAAATARIASQDCRVITALATGTLKVTLSTAPTSASGVLKYLRGGRRVSGAVTAGQANLTFTDANAYQQFTARNWAFLTDGVSVREIYGRFVQVREVNSGSNRVELTQDVAGDAFASGRTALVPGPFVENVTVKNFRLAGGTGAGTGTDRSLFLHHSVNVQIENVRQVGRAGLNDAADPLDEYPLSVQGCHRVFLQNVVWERGGVETRASSHAVVYRDCRLSDVLVTDYAGDVTFRDCDIKYAWTAGQTGAHHVQALGCRFWGMDTAAGGWTLGRESVVRDCRFVGSVSEGTASGYGCQLENIRGGSLRLTSAATGYTVQNLDVDGLAFEAGSTGTRLSPILVAGVPLGASAFQPASGNTASLVELVPCGTSDESAVALFNAANRSAALLVGVNGTLGYVSAANFGGTPPTEFAALLSVRCTSGLIIDSNSGFNPVTINQLALAFGGILSVRPSAGNSFMQMEMLPLGTQDESRLLLHNGPDRANSGALQVRVDGAGAFIETQLAGAGTPITLLTVSPVTLFTSAATHTGPITCTASASFQAPVALTSSGTATFASIAHFQNSLTLTTSGFAGTGVFSNTGDFSATSFRMQGDSGNRRTDLDLLPSGTEDRVQVHLLNDSDSTNTGSLRWMVDGATGYMETVTVGTGTAVTLFDWEVPIRFGFGTSAPVGFYDGFTLESSSGANPMSFAQTSAGSTASVLTLKPTTGNAICAINVAPLGTQDQTQFLLFNAADTSNAGYMRLSVDGASIFLEALSVGSGSAPTLFTVSPATQFDGNVGFYGTTPVAKPTVSGSRGGNAALASLLTALASQGLITNSTSA